MFVFVFKHIFMLLIHDKQGLWLLLHLFYIFQKSNTHKQMKTIQKLFLFSLDVGGDGKFDNCDANFFADKMWKICKKDNW